MYNIKISNQNIYSHVVPMEFEISVLVRFLK